MIDPLFRALIERELKNRFLGGVLSPIWWAVQPLLQLGVYALVFGLFLKIQLPPRYGESYVAYLAVGLWPWLAFTESVIRSASSLIAQGSLITKTALPRAWVPMSVVTVTFTLNFVALALIVLLLKALGIQLHLRGIVATIPAWLSMYLLALGVAWFVSVSHILVRDVEPMLGPLLFLLTFLAPIQYAIDIVPKHWQAVIHANPFTHVIERMHGVYLLGETTPNLTDAALLIGAAVVAWLGYRYFSRIAPHIDDYL